MNERLEKFERYVKPPTPEQREAREEIRSQWLDALSRDLCSVLDDRLRESLDTLGDFDYRMTHVDMRDCMRELLVDMVMWYE